MSVNVPAILEASDAILRGHFLLTSGLHSPRYLEKFRILQHPAHTESLCGLIADHYKDRGIEVVAGPALGGVVLAYEVARKLGVRCIFAEREGGKRVFRRGLSIRPAERVLIVDDILTTGGSIREVEEAVKEAGGRVEGIAVLIDRLDPSRTGRTVTFDAPLYSCHTLSIPTYTPETCPQCRSGVPLTRPGSSA